MGQSAARPAGSRAGKTTKTNRRRACRRTRRALVQHRKLRRGRGSVGRCRRAVHRLRVAWGQKSLLVPHLPPLMVGAAASDGRKNKETTRQSLSIMQPLARRALAASSRVDAKLGGQAGRDPPPSMDRRGGAGGASENRDSQKVQLAGYSLPVSRCTPLYPWMQTLGDLFTWKHE